MVSEGGHSIPWNGVTNGAKQRATGAPDLDMSASLRVLTLATDTTKAQRIETQLRKAFDAEVERVETEAEFRQRLSAKWDVVISEYLPNGFGATEALLL